LRDMTESASFEKTFSRGWLMSSGIVKMDHQSWRMCISPAV
jgi:hypothetical protein